MGFFGKVVKAIGGFFGGGSEAVQTGPKGGKYYINSHGNKEYGTPPKPKKPAAKGKPAPAPKAPKGKAPVKEKKTADVIPINKETKKKKAPAPAAKSAPAPAAKPPAPAPAPKVAAAPAPAPVAAPKSAQAPKPAPSETAKAAIAYPEHEKTAKKASEKANSTNTQDDHNSAAHAHTVAKMTATKAGMWGSVAYHDQKAGEHEKKASAAKPAATPAATPAAKPAVSYTPIPYKNLADAADTMSKVAEKSMLHWDHKEASKLHKDAAKALLGGGSGPNGLKYQGHLQKAFKHDQEVMKYEAEQKAKQQVTPAPAVEKHPSFQKAARDAVASEKFFSHPAVSEGMASMLSQYGSKAASKALVDAAAPHIAELTRVDRRTLTFDGAIAHGRTLALLELAHANMGVKSGPEVDAIRAAKKELSTVVNRPTVSEDGDIAGVKAALAKAGVFDKAKFAAAYPSGIVKHPTSIDVDAATKAAIVDFSGASYTEIRDAQSGRDWKAVRKYLDGGEPHGMLHRLAAHTEASALNTFNSKEPPPAMKDVPVVHRGISVDEKAFAKFFSASGTISWDCTTSTSTQTSTAMAFAAPTYAKPYSVVFSVRHKTAKSIKALSQHASESELFMGPGTKMKITKKTMYKRPGDALGGVLHIDLEEV